jgi:aminopeptidase-like protein
MWEMLEELFPISRSITGSGVRQTLDVLGRKLPLTLHSFPTGTKCFDWVIPDEWNILGAVLKDEQGKIIADFAVNNLHVLGYSRPIEGWFSLDELKPHLFSIPEQPEAIPYVTSYYSPNWGFCLRHSDLLALKEGRYYVKIDCSLEAGELILGEAFLPGQSDEEILISCYICHPSMANDSLSGVVLAAQLFSEVQRRERRFGYRFVFAPETIGVIAYLSRFGEHLKRHLRAGLVLTCVGDSGPFNYKQSRGGGTALDRIVANLLKFSGLPHRVRPFWPMGSDERQYCSPGFDLPVGSLMRSVYGEFPEYHTSDDNLDFVTADALEESLAMYLHVIEALEANRIYRRKDPECEPCLGRRGLYPNLSERTARSLELQRRMWILNLADGQHTLIDMAERMGCCILDLVPSMRVLREAELIIQI